YAPPGAAAETAAAGESARSHPAAARVARPTSAARRGALIDTFIPPSPCRVSRSGGLGSSLFRLDAQHRARGFVCDHVEQAVRALLHVANPLVKIDEQRLAPQLLHLLVEQDAIEMARAGNLALAQPADEHVTFPLRELVAGVEREARDRDRGRPVDHRRLVAVVRGHLVVERARIVAAIAHDRPAVILASLDDVELVAAVRAVLGLPELARHGMHCKAE